MLCCNISFKPIGYIISYFSDGETEAFSEEVVQSPTDSKAMEVEFENTNVHQINVSKKLQASIFLV